MKHGTGSELCRFLLVVVSSAAPLAAELRGTDWTWGPDRVGGYATTQVIVRVAENIAPSRLADGRLGLLGAEPEAETALAAALLRWRVTEIVPAVAPAAKDLQLARQLGLDRYYAVRVPKGTDTPALVAELSTFDVLIERAELDGIAGILATPNDQHFGVQYALHNTGQTVNGQAGTPDADIDAPEAWDLHTGTSNRIVAIIDTGVSTSHPEFSGKLVPGQNFTGGDPSNTDDGWLISHGTHCAGIVGAKTNNSQGIAGVSWGTLIMPVKVLDWLGSGQESWCANGIIWAADHGAHVASMSWGSTTPSSLIESAVNYAWGKGLVLVAASGNTAGAPISYPAAYPNVIAVGATDNRDNLASFTSTGPEMDVSAPGVDVYSCWDTLFSPNTYSYQSGTSMACPHVSGLAALVWSAKLTLTNTEVRQIIEATCDDKGTPGWDPQFGWGRINAYKAVKAALTPQWQDGDMNCDGTVNFADINPFVLALSDPAGYAANYPNCDIMNGDCNNDGQVNFDDINPFVGLLTGR